MLHDILKFPCDCCGECCRHIGNIPQLKAYDIGNGVCKYLEGNLCTIYETRPEICRVDTMYDRYFSNFYTREDFYRINTAGCAELKKYLVDTNSNAKV